MTAIAYVPYGGAAAAPSEAREERDARIAAKIRANRLILAAQPPEISVSVAECGALIWAAPYRMTYGPLSVFEEFTFGHYGRTMAVLYNTTTGDVGLVRRCRGPHDGDEFSALIGGTLTMLATMSLRHGIENARIVIHRSEILTDTAPMRAFAAVIRRKYPELSFSGMQVLSEWMGSVVTTFREYMDNSLRCEALTAADRNLMMATAKAHYGIGPGSCAF